MSIPDIVPDRLARTIIDLYEDEGSAWLERLPALIAACEERWGLVVSPAFPNLSYNYVAPAASATGEPVVLKLGVPNPELTSEAAALHLYNGQGCARLIAADVKIGALVIERLQPGMPLQALTDDREATSIAAQVMRQLWRPAPIDHPFPTVAGWAQGLARLRASFDGGTGPFPMRLVEQAEALFSELIASTDSEVVLHGDLHHENILSADRAAWLAIDPKGVVGDAGYEVGALLRNRLDIDHNLKRLLARRVDQLAEELAIDRARLAGWGAAGTVLSAWWEWEDHGSYNDETIAIATIVADLL